MRTTPIIRTFLMPFLGLLLVASLGTGCSGCGGGATDAAADAPARNDGTDAHDAAGNGADGSHDGHDHATGTGDGHDLGHSNADHATMNTTDPWTRTYATPEAERAGTMENLNGLRATLVAELESVRGRLKDGGRSAEDRKADSQRAAELAQGLERLDRTIKQISEANDVTWADVRDSSIKAAGEFREWMARYGMPS